MRWLLPPRTPQGARVVAYLLIVVMATVSWLVFRRPVGSIFIGILGVFGTWQMQNRLPSRWWYLPAGAAFLASVLIGRLAHGVGLRDIGVLLLAAGISFGVGTFGARVMHDSYAAELEAAELRESEKARFDT